MLNVYRYEKSVEEICLAKRPTIFLAGPTVRGNQTHLISWRFDAIKEFEKQNFSGSLIIPEFTSKTESDKGKDWIITWENTGLNQADCIMFWIPRTRELIGLTTNFEIGYWLSRDPYKIVYGRPDDAYFIDYVDVMWSLHFTKELNKVSCVYKTLKGTVEAAMLIAKTNVYNIIL